MCDRIKEAMTEEEARARKKALALLNVMDRSEAGLLRKLRDNGFSEEAAEDALAYVKAFGYVDDERYARNYLATTGRRRSRKRIFMDLKQRGIPEEIIEKLRMEEDGADETELIRRLALKKLKGRDVKDPLVRQKTIAYLNGKGFRLSEILKVMDRIGEEDFLQ